ncbi:Similar to CDP-glucose 4,6-dehydratase [Halanaerobium saccharolyticum subsp. saccharolyticum DSM 6643]|uniref:Similar to CDP-glucose 4,6-dehydratase n=1 Tax=Halanaerobium saccharolyticum subsp. saccharolyticum DSM 6643 TaxID=1293054 RepID=M5E409_9FIRM|nr:CDP-glucose 4,6-dehydratase [Halanaerobium saccharolyticum]CCU80951.1 Similar to CDP-glucose 4,6-dehydratase [Halanaerobium saccharolyticum subsp. saccharolyticum DSM 6643]
MEELFDGIYNNKNVLVTGHTGFKGSWLSIWLNELGANVIGYALDPYTDQDNFVVTNLSEKITDLRGEIRDYDNLLRTFKEEKPEIVFHLAAQPLVRLSYKEPRETYEVNVMGTVNVLEAARQSDSVKTVIIITSDKCYENNEWIWGYRENDPMGGYDPYSSSKGCAELVTSAYTRSFFDNEDSDIAVASVRAGNVIGGGDWAADRLITDCISYLKRDKAIEIRSPKAIRPWQHVLEPLRGYLLLASKLYQNPEKYTGAWNFGPDEASIVTVGELVDKLVNKWGSGEWIDTSNSNEPHEAKLLKLDISKARQHLNWEPKLSFDQTIDLVVDWYQNDNVDYDFDVEQIKEYMRVDK